jgi:hypothetical protein
MNKIIYIILIIYIYIYIAQHYVIKFVSDLLQVGGFLLVLPFHKYALDISAYCLCKHVSLSKQGRHMMENSIEFDKTYYLRGSKCRSSQSEI